MAKTYLDETVTMQRLTFERLKQSMSKTLGYTLLDDLNIRSYEDVGIHGMVIEFTAGVLAQRLADDKYTAHFRYKVPSSWWQHFKLEKAPKWFVGRYPVKYDTKHQTRTVKFTRYATYPMANIAIPKDQHTISMLGAQEVLKDTVYQVEAP